MYYPSGAKYIGDWKNDIRDGNGVYYWDDDNKYEGETKSRIFVKGKYFPGLINTRSLGDHIGKGIGILSKPHVTKHRLNKSQKYFLLMCSDGISNVCNISKLVNLVQRNEQLLLESVTSIIAESRGMYRTHSYTPDMTLLIKEFKFEEF